jgi:hypothetical protein
MFSNSFYNARIRYMNLISSLNGDYHIRYCFYPSADQSKSGKDISEYQDLHIQTLNVLEVIATDITPYQLSN